MGDVKGLTLTQKRKGTQSEYHVYEQDENRSLWFEGSEFYSSISRHHISPVRSVKKHTFVIHHYVDGNGVDSDKIVGVAHDKQELMKETYKCATDYCKRRCKKMKGKFSDLTSKLESRAK